MVKLSEVLLNPKKAKRHPFEILFAGFFYASISILVSLWIFPEHASLLMVFLTVISCLYIAQGALIVEEKKEKNYNPESLLLRSHIRTLVFFMLLFLGFLAAFTFWTLVLPEQTLAKSFQMQSSTFENIQDITGRSVYFDNFSTILSNNLRVLILSLVLALFYGAGAIFILAWNASIMGFVIGSLARNTLGLASLPHLFMKYFLHGIPEMLAYFAASLAGGILFISLIKGDLKEGRAKRTIVDVLILIASSVILLIAAALIETYISPLI